MPDVSSWNESNHDLEAVIRLAGGYVQPSDDLRPRTLEAARTQQSERRVRRKLWQATFLVGFLVSGLAWLGWQNQWPAAICADNPRNASTLRDDADQDQPSHERHWDTVDSFRDLRLRQARLFKFPF